jgi:ketosteroid isomerase-like protein
MTFLLRGALCLAPVLLAAQTNLRFTEGLNGWIVPAASSSAGYSAEARADGCRSTACAVVVAPAEPPALGLGNLQQSFDAAAYRGKTVRLRAWLRVEGNDPSARAQLWLRVDLPGGRLGFFDTMGDRPVTSRQWQACEITGEVAADAKTISLGVLSRGKGKVWADGAVFEILGGVSGPRATADRAAIRALYARVDAAYGAGDVDAVASFALPSAQVVLGPEKVPLADALAPIMDDLRNGMKFRSESDVTSIELSGDTATVFVNNVVTRTRAGSQASVASSTRDTWVRTAAGWRLKESILIDTHQVKTGR